MRVLVTLDHYNGSQSKVKEVDLETFNVRDLIFSMTSSSVCGFTVTKLDSAAKLLRKIEELNPNDN